MKTAKAKTTYNGLIAGREYEVIGVTDAGHLQIYLDRKIGDEIMSDLVTIPQSYFEAFETPTPESVPAVPAVSPHVQPINSQCVLLKNDGTYIMIAPVGPNIFKEV